MEEMNEKINFLLIPYPSLSQQFQVFVPPQQESHETTQPAQVTDMRYDGQQTAAAKAKKAQQSTNLKVSILKFNKFRRENLKRKG